MFFVFVFRLKMDTEIEENPSQENITFKSLVNIFMKISDILIRIFFRVFMIHYVKHVKNLVGKHQQKFNVNHYLLLFKVKFY